MKDAEEKRFGIIYLEEWSNHASQKPDIQTWTTKDNKAVALAAMRRVSAPAQEGGDNAMRAALVKALPILKELASDIGDDHSVNVCNCEIVGLCEEIDAALKASPEPVSDAGGSGGGYALKSGWLADDMKEASKRVASNFGRNIALSKPAPAVVDETPEGYGDFHVSYDDSMKSYSLNWFSTGYWITADPSGSLIIGQLPNGEASKTNIAALASPNPQAPAVWTPEERKVLDGLMVKNDLSEHAVLRQGLRLYQLQDAGPLQRKINIPKTSPEQAEYLATLLPSSSDAPESEGLAGELEEASNIPKVYDYAETGQDLEDLFDIGLRHKTGVKPEDRLKRWLSIFRPFAYATHDDSWGELEKEIAIVLTQYVKRTRLLRRAAQALRGA